MHVAHPPDHVRVLPSDVLDEVGEEAEDLLVEVAVRRPEGGRRLGPRLTVAEVAAVEAGSGEQAWFEFGSLLVSPSGTLKEGKL